MREVPGSIPGTAPINKASHYVTSYEIDMPAAPQGLPRRSPTPVLTGPCEGSPPGFDGAGFSLMADAKFETTNHEETKREYLHLVFNVWRLGTVVYIL